MYVWAYWTEVYGSVAQGCRPGNMPISLRILGPQLFGETPSDHPIVSGQVRSGQPFYKEAALSCRTSWTNGNGCRGRSEAFSSRRPQHRCSARRRIDLPPPSPIETKDNQTRRCKNTPLQCDRRTDAPIPSPPSYGRAPSYAGGRCGFQPRP